MSAEMPAAHDDADETDTAAVTESADADEEAVAAAPETDDAAE